MASKRAKSAEEGWTAVISDNGTARCGTLGSFATPTIAIPTVGGLVPHLTSDIWEQEGKYDNAVLCVPYEQAAVFTHAPEGQDLHCCLNQNPKQVLLLVQMPKPTKTNLGELMEISKLVESKLQPNLWVSPGDDINAYTGNNRCYLAVERTTAFGVKSPSGLACIVGKDERSALACLEKSTSGNNGGVWVEVSSKSLALDLCAKLPGDKLRVVNGGTATPRQVLEYIAHGYDLVQTNYPQHLAKMGFASTFPIDLEEKNVYGSDTHDMRDSSLLVDHQPILPTCQCFTCLHHTRAYLRHLLETKEMLGETLLYAHNLYRLMELVRVARIHLANGTFEQWYEAM
ncbi:hypothetical protein BASA81_001765 [Batrachochytrium salamandrivorans]|nr:hypothetical protein BASA81_001765 [Batrachochytrium salamandrivorans]